MIGNGLNRRSEFKRKFAVFRMARYKALCVVEDILADLVNSVLGNGILNEDNSAYADGNGVLGGLINILGNGAL